MKVYIKKFSTYKFKIELLHQFIIFLENRYKKNIIYYLMIYIVL